MHQKPKIVAVRRVTEGRFFAIEDVDLAFSNGRKATFERIASAGGAVMVVPMTESGVIMVSEYAVGTDRYELGFVKGRIDSGETPNQAAQRELQEEIGFGARELVYIRELRDIPHYSDFSMHLFLATDLYPQSREGDEIEPLGQVSYTFDQIDPLIDGNDISDSRTLTALLLARRWYNLLNAN